MSFMQAHTIFRIPVTDGKKKLNFYVYLIKHQAMEVC
jgi:hypothetical protein